MFCRLKWSVLDHLLLNNFKIWIVWGTVYDSFHFFANLRLWSVSCILYNMIQVIYLCHRILCLYSYYLWIKSYFFLLNLFAFNSIFVLFSLALSYSKKRKTTVRPVILALLWILWIKNNDDYRFPLTDWGSSIFRFLRVLFYGYARINVWWISSSGFDLFI